MGGSWNKLVVLNTDGRFEVVVMFFFVPVAALFVFFTGALGLLITFGEGASSSVSSPSSSVTSLSVRI